MEKPRYKNWMPLWLVATVLAGALALLLIARLLVEKSAITGMALMLLSFAALFFGLYLLRVRTALDSLVSRAAQLSQVSLEPPKRKIGKNTMECLRSGIIYGNAACIDGMIDRFEEELGQKATVIATGGLARVIVPQCRREIILDDDLLLKGLQVIYEKNRK